MARNKRWLWAALLGSIFAVGCGGPECGNAELEEGEQCDLGAENSDTGTCTTSCANARCGDGFVQGVEACDDGNTIDNDACSNVCTVPPSCGDNAVNQVTEVCDGTALNNQDCTSQGFVDGTLACNIDCGGFDTSGCSTCGDNIADQGETCDGSDLGAEDCTTQGNFIGGALGCDADCGGFDTTLCTPDPCGNGVLDAGEDCDANLLGGESCTTQGFDAGTLACNADCTFDVGACVNNCGNGVLDAGEDCDGINLNNEDCADQAGFNLGTLACNAPGGANECTFDVGACILATCGNGALDAGETCDGALLNNQDCSTINQGFSSGTLACDATCQAFDTAACVADGVTFCETLAPLGTGETCAVVAGNDAKLIKGDILTPGNVLKGGQVLVAANGDILCTACDCSAQAAGATQITCPTGVVSPGLINMHDHITFAQNLPYIQSPERYEQRHDWRTGARGHSEIPSSGGASADEIRWGELRFLMSGTTAGATEGSQPGLIRNLDSNNQDGLGQAVVQTETFPLDDIGGTQRNGDCNYGGTPDTAASISAVSYLGHVSEGIDAVSRNEFLCTSSATFDTLAPGTSNDLVLPQSGFTHSIGFKASDYAQMAQDSTALVWSPRSNVTLYGDTAVVTQASNLGVLITLGSDWVVTGSMNMTRELVCADELNTNYYNGFFSDKELWEMATINAATALAADDVIGALAVGKKADISIYNGAVSQAHRAVIDAQPEDVVLVMRGGRIMYGDAGVVATIPNTGTCDLVQSAAGVNQFADVCGVQKRLCGDIGQSFTALENTNDALYPAFFCGIPQNEPSCLPERTNTSAGAGFPLASQNGSSVYTGIISANDSDGDSILNATDNCADIFNPIRPVDNGVQADFDTDGVGDACDVCPLDANTTTCTVFDPNDADNDGIQNVNDNCPGDANNDQADADADLKGDVCDACPADANPGNEGCPATIYQVKDGTIPVGANVRVGNGLVTGKGSNGFFMQVKDGDAGFAGVNFSGIFVFSGVSTLDDAVLVGNRVTVDGTVTLFQGQIEIASLTGLIIDNAAVEPPPAPVIVTVAEATTGGARATQLESVVVEIANVTVTAPFNAFNEVEFTDATNATMLGDDFLFLPSPPSVGDFFQIARGVLALRTIGGGQSASKLHPRNAGDLIEGLTLASFSPTAQFLEIGDVAQSTFPTPLTVTLNLPAPVDTFVGVVSSDQNIVAVENNGVTIPAGATSAPVLLTAINGVGTVTLTATLGAVNLTATVTVNDPAQVPALLSLDPADSNVISGSTITFTVALDIPAEADTIVALNLNPSNAGTIPATVTIPSGQLSATFDYIDGGVVIGSLIEVSATLNAVVLTADVTAFVSTIDHLVINELDYDQTGTDANSYIEIFNGTGSAVSLANLAVVLVNGGNNLEYARFNLSAAGATLPNNAFLVIGNASIVSTLPVGTLSITANNDFVQNGGPDGIAIIDTAALTVEDALSYEGSITTATITGFAGTVTLVEGTAFGGADTNDDLNSLARSPNGADADNAVADWIVTTTKTPGAANP